jgi:DNA helicase II / ATP-dependent DNA helicase PcrA
VLTREQQAAVRSKSKKILVRAGAGTGKTEVLTRRVIHLLEEDPTLSINHFAIITFTNKATENVKNRLQKSMYHKWKLTNDLEEKERYRYELEMLNRAQVSTIHSFCRFIIDLAGPFHTDKIHYAPGYKISEAVLFEALDFVMQGWTGNPNTTQSILEYLPIHQVRKEVLNLYRKIRSFGLPMEKIKKVTETSIILDEDGYTKNIKSELLSLVLELEKEYLRRKLLHLSTDDLLEYAYRVLEQDADLVVRVQKRFRHIFVDEFQDTSWFQTQIINLICSSSKESPSLFVVGDSKQSIYQFRGADIESYQSVEHLIRLEGEVLTLRTNFRSKKPLVDYVNRMFGLMKFNENLPEFQAEDLIPHDQTTGSSEEFVKYIPLDGFEEAERIAAFIQEEVESGENYGDFAILFRTNRNMGDYEEIFRQYDIPTQLIGAGNYYKKKEILDIFKVLNFLATPFDVLKREEAVNTDFLLGSDQKLTELHAFINPFMMKYTIAQIIEEVYRFCRIRELYSCLNNMQAAANLEKLKEITRQLNHRETIQLVDYVGWLGKRIATNDEEQQVDLLGSDLNAVTLITIHKAKGLEFPYVILPELNRNILSQGLIPSILYSIDTGIEFSIKQYTKNYYVSSTHYAKVKDEYERQYLAEEARVLYVAMTRAERKLYFIQETVKSKLKKKGVAYQDWLGEGIGQLERKRIEYQDELEQLLHSKTKQVPKGPSKWIHQEEAKKAFLEIGHGILEMATGTGKTRTAINIINHLITNGEINSVIITVDGNDLLDQWAKEIIKHTNLQVYKQYEKNKELAMYQSFPEEAALLVSRKAIAQSLKYINKIIQKKTLIICDEIHGMGSAMLREELSGRIKPFKYRLGLSATPERAYDEDGNLFIEEEIGKVIYRFGLDKAIRKGILCEFNYIPLHYDRTEEDQIEIKRIIKAFYARKKAGEPVRKEMLFNDISRVKKNSYGKLNPFLSFIKENPHLLKRSIIFVETKEFGIKVQEIILPYIKNYHTYFGEDNRDKLVQFSNAELDCLITSKRISEGIDIQSVENVILFTADRTSLLTIQRIGRCLRIDPNNPDKRANIIDFIENNEQSDEEQITTDQKREKWLTELSAIRRENEVVE